ncbi:MAG: MFS transporter [Micrococcaceae bacterium]
MSNENIISKEVKDLENLDKTLPKNYLPTVGFANFAIYMALMTPVLVSLAFKLEHITKSQAAATAAQGTVLGLGALCAAIVNPIAGRLSDRTTSKFGMRRPWIAGGAVAGFIGLLMIGVAQSVPVVILGWCITQTAFNASLAALNVTVADTVPMAKRGIVSGFIGVMFPAGVLIGTILVRAIATDLPRFLIPATTALIGLLLFAFFFKDRVLPKSQKVPFDFKTLIGTFYFNPKKNPDFAWVVITKFIFMTGYAGIASYLPFFVTSRFHLDEKEALNIITLSTTVSTILLAVSSFIGGWISDKVGKRRPLVMAAGIIVAIGLAILAVAPSPGWVVFAQAISGFGTGAYLSVDLALATSTLPSEDEAAKDLGIFNLANALAQSVAPAVAPGIIALGAAAAIGGYGVFFLVGALFVLIGSITIYQVKSIA